MSYRLAILCLALVGWGVVVSLLGCSNTGSQRSETPAALSLRLEVEAIGREQVKELLGAVQRLRTASHESFDAAVRIGAPDLELAEARQALAMAEPQVRAGEGAYGAKQYQESWEKLGAAKVALRRAEEAAVRAGLRHIDRALAQEYAHLQAVKQQPKRPASGVVRVSDNVVNVRDGAGTEFPVVRKVRLGDILDLLAEAAEWYYVRTPDGQQGWVFKGLVTMVAEVGAR